MAEEAQASRPPGCTSCGIISPAAARFCMNCGAPLGDAAGAGGPESERKVVSVLYADLSGSLSLIREFDCEDAAGLLDRAVDAMRRSVRRFGGFVAQNLGDGVMALFGAPVAVEDHAARAAFAALDMLGAIDRLNRERQSQPALTLRVGINTGEAMVRPVEDDTALHYSAVGPVNHLAARMEKTAEPGTVRLTGTTARALAGLFRLRSLGRVEVSGMAEPVAAFQLLGADPWEGSFRVRSGRGLTPFVAREGELATVAAALREAFLGQARAVTVIGEAGVGKSRLVHEALGRELPEAGVVYAGGGRAYGEVTPWLPVAGIVRRVCGIGDADPAEIAGEKVRGALARFAIDEPEVELALLACLDLAGADPAWQAMEPTARRNRLHEALDRILQALTDRGPVAIVIEDLHWVDSETIAYLDRLTIGLGERRLALVTTARPSFAPPWSGRRGCLGVLLEPLAGSGIQALVEAIMGADPTLERLKPELSRRVAGNPFFAEESIRELADLGWLAGGQGAWKLIRPLGAIPLPTSVQATVAARIDRLPLADRAVLRAAAVLGQAVDPLLLERVATLSAESVDSSLQRLVAADFLFNSVSPGRQGYRFRHALTREVAYDGMLHRRRRELHRRAAAAMEGEIPALPAEQLAAFARHSLAAELWPRAHAAYAELATRALGRSAARDALAACEMALAALRASERPSDPAAELALRFMESEAHFSLGDHELVRLSADRAFALASAVKDQVGVVRALTMRAMQAWMGGRTREAVSAGIEARRHANLSKDGRLRIAASARLGMLRCAWGDYVGSAAVLREAMELVAQHQDTAERFGLLGVGAVIVPALLARVLSELNEADEVLSLSAHVIDLQERVAHPFSSMYASQEIGLALLRLGRPELARSVLESGYQLATSHDRNLLFPAIAAELGVALVRCGDSRGLTLVETGVEFASQHKLIPQFGQQVGLLAEALAATGELDRAISAARAAVELTQRNQERGDTLWIAFDLARSQSLRFGLQADWVHRVRLIGRQAKRLHMVRLMGEMQPLAALARQSLQISGNRQAA